MNFIASINLFQSALGGSTLPDFRPDEPFQAGLILEGNDDPVGVELLSLLAGDDADNVKVQARMLSDGSDPPLSEGTDFFLTRSGKMLGRGRIESIVSA